jgi:hypothetical protein
VAKVVKLALIFSDGINTDIVTRFYLAYAGSAPDSSALNTFCLDVKNEFGTSLVGDLNNSYALGRVHAIDLSSATGAEGDWLGVLNGTATDPPLPSDVAVVTSYEIARRYRGGHPRGYWPLGQSTNLDNPQLWTDAFVGGLQTSMETFFAAVLADVWPGGGPLSHVNVSYFHGFTVVTNPTTGRARNVPTVRATPLVDTVSSLVVRKHIGTQRRRLQY